VTAIFGRRGGKRAGVIGAAAQAMKSADA